MEMQSEPVTYLLITYLLTWLLIASLYFIVYVCCRLWS